MKIVTFGEILLKFSPPNYQRFLQATAMDAEYSGAEANVAVSLARFGVDSAFVSKVPENDLGEAALNALRHHGVDISHVARGGERIGIYFAEKGASQRPSKVIYDRKGSAIACATTADFDWNAIFEGADWFHFTGITPALSDSLASICLEACQAARAKGMTISCDLNYRQKLWSCEKAKAVMTDLCRFVDVCIANEEDAADVFGIRTVDRDGFTGTLDGGSYVFVARQLQERFGFKKVAITLRESISASDNNWSAILCDGAKTCTSRKYAIHIVDRIGSGDSFCAGLIYGLHHYGDRQQALEFAVAASCLKQTMEGDFNLAGVAEVEGLLNGDVTGRIKR